MHDMAEPASAREFVGDIEAKSCCIFGFLIMEIMFFFGRWLPLPTKTCELRERPTSVLSKEKVNSII
jgi:hypothetical protein